jgi:hypothetical protein
MARVAITLDEARTRFKCAHAAAVKAEPLCRPIFERWRADVLAAATGEADAVVAVRGHRRAAEVAGNPIPKGGNKQQGRR